MSRAQALISLENFNSESTEAALINSPRSLEACKQQGIKPEDLVKMTREGLKAKFEQENFQLGNQFEKHYKHHEEKRIQKIDMLKKIRNGLIKGNSGEDQKSPMSNSSKSTSPSSKYTVKSPVNATLLRPGLISMDEREKLLADRLRETQSKQIQKVMQDVEKMEAQLKQNILKAEKTKEKQEKHAQEVDLKIKLTQEERKKQEDGRLERGRQMEEEEQRKRRQKSLLEQEKQEKELQKKQEKEKEAQLKMEEKKKRAEEVQRQLDTILEEKERQHKEKQETLEAKMRREHEKKLQKEKELQKKEQERKQREHGVQKQYGSLLQDEAKKNKEKKEAEEERERQKKLKNDQLEAERLKEVEQTHKHIEDTLLAAKENEQEYNEKQKEKLKKELQQGREKKEHLEKQKNLTIEQIRTELQQKAEGANRVMEENDDKADKKKNDYLSKKELEAQRQAEQTRQKKLELEEKRRKEIEKEEKIRDMVKRNDHQSMTERNDKMMTKLTLTEEKIMNIQKRTQDHLDKKKNMNNIKSQELLRNIVKIQEEQDLKNSKLLEKMTKDHQRTTMMKKEQESIIQLHHKLRNDMETKKKDILSAYYSKMQQIKANTSM